MRFENELPKIAYYYDVNGKQKGNLFVVHFSYGRMVDEKTDFRFHHEFFGCLTFDDMLAKQQEFKQYCLDKGFTQVTRKGKRHVIT